MTLQQLGRLEKVDLRTVWEREDTGFTLWLKQPENLALLGQALDLTLTYEAHEKKVGPFRADILCRDGDEDLVLIENQLETTDHTHLGQLMTYAASLKTVTIVWIAARFTEEHRAALDWLNQITSEGINFFGLEVELWRIGNSPAAPKFNVVCQPNNWTRAAANSGEITETKQLQWAYWTALKDFFASDPLVLQPQKAKPQHWISFATGRSDFRYSAIANTRDRRIGLVLVIKGPARWAHYNLLLTQKDQIEQELGEGLEWKALEHKKESRIVLHNLQLDPNHQASWSVQHGWFLNAVKRFQQVFGERIRLLKASDWQDASTEDTEETTED